MRTRKSRRIPINASPRRVQRTMDRMGYGKKKPVPNKTMMEKFAGLLHKAYFGEKK